MAAAQDLEHGQMFSNSQSPPPLRNPGRGYFDPTFRLPILGQEPSLDSPRDAELQGGPSQLRVDVTVLRAHNIPRLKNVFGLKFFVTVAGQAIEMRTPSVPAKRRTARWGESLGTFILQPSIPLILRLYAERFAGRDILIGEHEMIPVESQTDTPCVLTNGDVQAGESVTLYLAVIVSPNTTPGPTFNTFIIRSTTINGSPSGEAEKPSVAQEFTNPTRSTIIPETLSPPTDNFPRSEISTLIPPAADRRGVSPAVSALHGAGEAMATINLSNKWEGALGRIKWVMDTVNPVAELHPYAKMAYNILFAFPKTLLEQSQRDDNIGTLLVAMHDAFDFANQEDRFKAIGRDSRQAQILMLMLQHVCNCCDFIRSYAKDSQLWKRILQNTGSQVDKKIEDFRAVLLEHRKAFLDEASITTEITVLQILDDMGIISGRLDGMTTQLKSRLKWVSIQVSDAELDRKIGEIPYGTGSRFTPSKGCLTGTRTAFLDFIVNWVNDPASERCLVLFGQAGTGKSSIAHEIARRFDKIHRLTSSFIFLRTEQSKREAYHLFTTLARDLSDRYPSFKAALGRVVKDNSSLRAGTRDYATLFESLILEPLKDLHIVGPILVVIDALDESGDVTSKNGLHKFLAEAISKLQSNFRVLITSRPEHAIESAFAEGVKIKYMNDTELAATTYNDILAFLQKELPPDVKTYGDELTKRAEGSFQWAAVACGYILNPPDVFGLSKINCINHLLKLNADHRGQDPLDELYKEVLEGYFTHENSRLLFRSVMGHLIASFEPLSIRSLTTLRHTSEGDAVVTLLRRLGSLLSNVNSSDENLPIIPLHTSFRDFLTTKEKSGDFCVSLRDAHHQLAHSCLNLLLKDLKFNICNLETSYLANKDVTDLSSRVDKHISPALLYACRFWDAHMEHNGFESDLFGRLRTFFEDKLLFWLEALSLTSDLGLASATCSTVSTWLISGKADTQGVSQNELGKLRSFVNDASVFIRHFGMAMAKSAPHVYVSALPFAPSGSPVSARYSSSFPRILRVERGRFSHWPSSEMVIPNPGGMVFSISVSPDGQRIVSGSSDRTIRVWNTTTGEMEVGPFTGHTDLVNSVAFSSDGQRIVSGSSDRTICVWNSSTGETEAGPFIGHTHWVNSVAFSPDGQRIVSGSEDRTIRVWNASTGETDAGPFTGHTHSVNSVAFMPDGQCIVSGSSDRTIRVWNASTGETEAGPFTGHTHSVNSVAFSPDGQRIVSGSDDLTIRVWNATTGETDAGPFTGHTHSVNSVVFSSDGRRIVSGSSDRTIRMWNASTGETEAGPFTGHTNWVRSVAFSPDGQRIVSGSHDQTIHVWNATTGETEAGSFTGHTHSINSVAFSPDGQRIVSGSDDRTTRVWNATTGETEAGPFTGHTNWVRSVAFSPDGQRIVSGSSDRTIRVWNASTGETEAGPFTGHTHLVFSVAFSPDGQWIVSGSSDQTIRVWNATTGETEAGTFTGHTDWVRSVAFSPDGQRVISGSSDGTIRVWNATTGETEAGPFTGHTNWVRSVAFSPDGQRIVSGSSDRTIRVWNASTGETEAGPFTGHTHWVNSVAFSPDGQRIVSGSFDRTIRVWNATTGETEAGPFTGHTHWVNSVAFSPDGHRIVSGSEDRTIRVWNATTEAGASTSHTNWVRSVAFSPDGQQIVSGSDDREIRVLPVNATIGSTETKSYVDFTNHSVINEEGWICGSKGELLLWIPQTRRANLHRPSNIWVAGEYETRLDLSTFVHGQSWTTCINT